MANFIENALSQLFDNIESNSKVKFATFTTNDKPSETKSVNSDQKYMKAYEDDVADNQIYKYLYDPSLSFDSRFHQRLSRITYGERNQPWCTLIFNTNTNQPLNNVLSHVYKGMEIITRNDGTSEGVEYLFRRVKTPINFTIVSNDLNYLYETTEKIAMYFDRIINFPYKQTLKFTEEYSHTYDLVGMATDIKQVNLNKLDTASRGSLVMSGFSFNLLHYVVILPNSSVGLLEKIIVEIKSIGSNEPIDLLIVE